MRFYPYCHAKQKPALRAKAAGLARAGCKARRGVTKIVFSDLLGYVLIFVKKSCISVQIGITYLENIFWITCVPVSDT